MVRIIATPEDALEYEEICLDATEVQRQTAVTNIYIIYAHTSNVSTTLCERCFDSTLKRLDLDPWMYKTSMDILNTILHSVRLYSDKVFFQQTPDTGHYVSIVSSPGFCWVSKQREGVVHSLKAKIVRNCNKITLKGFSGFWFR